ncbi:hypothetical protein F0562_014699 [Nyssa sinensis]|uniref:Uncharacterized protein n=1 Tax=Nyssa sinensis TaxID=561372 RepID=A0A5J4ZNI0_9ASTE|nr:hypothetical protein F0562_014699 [Nyssa sinensis]
MVEGGFSNFKYQRGELGPLKGLNGSFGPEVPLGQLLWRIQGDYRDNAVAHKSPLVKAIGPIKGQASCSAVPQEAQLGMQIEVRKEVNIRLGEGAEREKERGKEKGKAQSKGDGDDQTLRFLGYDQSVQPQFQSLGFMQIGEQVQTEKAEREYESEQTTPTQDQTLREGNQIVEYVEEAEIVLLDCEPLATLPPDSERQRQKKDKLSRWTLRRIKGVSHYFGVSCHGYEDRFMGLIWEILEIMSRV